MVGREIALVSGTSSPTGASFASDPSEEEEEEASLSSAMAFVGERLFLMFDIAFIFSIDIPSNSSASIVNLRSFFGLAADFFFAFLTRVFFSSTGAGGAGGGVGGLGGSCGIWGDCCSSDDCCSCGDCGDYSSYGDCGDYNSYGDCGDCGSCGS